MNPVFVVIEDDPAQRFTLCNLIEDRFPSATVHELGDMASVDRLVASGKTVTAAIIDLRLRDPGIIDILREHSPDEGVIQAIDGVKAALALRNNKRCEYFLLVTASDSHEDLGPRIEKITGLKLIQKKDGDRFNATILEFLTKSVGDIQNGE